MRDASGPNPFETSARPKVTPAKRARPARAAVSRKAATPPPQTYVSASMLSPEEKRQIILAHAEMNQPHDPVQVLSMWAGVAVCVMAVAVGWWWSVGTEFSGGLSHSVSSLKAQAAEAEQTVKQYADSVAPDGFTAPLKAINDHIQEVHNNSLAQEQAKAQLQDLLQNSSAGSTAGRNIFVPQAGAATSSNN